MPRCRCSDYRCKWAKALTAEDSTSSNIGPCAAEAGSLRQDPTLWCPQQRGSGDGSQSPRYEYHRQPDCLTHGVQNGCKTECILGTQVKRILWSVETVLRD